MTKSVLRVSLLEERRFFKSIANHLVELELHRSYFLWCSCRLFYTPWTKCNIILQYAYEPIAVSAVLAAPIVIDSASADILCGAIHIKSAVVADISAETTLIRMSTSTGIDVASHINKFVR